jgi:hypothetical protein
MSNAKTLELTLTYRRDRWHATGEGVDVAHSDLTELDMLIAAAARRAPPRHVHVHVRFDTSGLPAWMRQYQSHYFNYVLGVNRETGA